MNILNNTINRIGYLIKMLPDNIEMIPEKELHLKSAPEKWSKKEILGHLCDSAINNLSRFVRVQFEEQPFKVINYEQDNWVRVNNYQTSPLDSIIDFWITANSRIVDVISKIPEDKLACVCIIPEGDTKSLLWLIEDYLAHMEYHLKQIVGDEFKTDEKHPQE
jgi:hypothetical protein